MSKDNESNIILSKIKQSQLKKLNKDKENLRYFFRKCIIKNLTNDKLFIDYMLNEKNHKKLLVLSYIHDYEKSIKELCGTLNTEFNCISAKISYKLAIGLGNYNVTETDITLHHIYGVPYIPGQALKGSTRNYFLEEYFDIESGKFCYIIINGVKVDGKSLYEYIFGDDFFTNNNQKGNVIFFDSFPIDNFIIEKDVMTVHYKEYYNNNEAPLDSFNPTPIPFYTIKDTKFNFMFSVKKGIFIIKDEDGNTKIQIEEKYLVKFIYDLIKDMLINHGIGAKTSVGYGYFNV